MNWEFFRISATAAIWSSRLFACARSVQLVTCATSFPFIFFFFLFLLLKFASLLIAAAFHSLIYVRRWSYMYNAWRGWMCEFCKWRIGCGWWRQGIGGREGCGGQKVSSSWQKYKCDVHKTKMVQPHTMGGSRRLPSPPPTVRGTIIIIAPYNIKKRKRTSEHTYMDRKRYLYAVFDKISKHKKIERIFLYLYWFNGLKTRLCLAFFYKTIYQYFHKTYTYT